MRSLALFESDSTFQPADCEDIVFGYGYIAVMAALLLGFMVLRHRVLARTGGGRPHGPAWLLGGWAAFVVGIVCLRRFVGGAPPGAMLVTGVFTLLYLYLLALTVGLVYRIVRGPWKVPQKTALAIAALAPFGAALAAYAVATAPYNVYLPASYPQEIRDQLRMARRIMAFEHPEDTTTVAVLKPLTSATLVLKSQETIPDSIRHNGEYNGYRYTLKGDAATSGAFALDAVPIEYKPGMMSFHGFAPGGDSSRWFGACITMADRHGQPALETDRHYHEKPLFGRADRTLP